eukprot:bmy_06878T0
MLNQTSCPLPPSPRQPPPVSTVGVSGLSCTSVCAGVSPRAELGTHGEPVYAYSGQWHPVTVRTGVGATGSRAETLGTTGTRQSSEWTGPSRPRAFSSGAPGRGWSLRPVLLFLRFCAPLPDCGCRACAPPSPPPSTASAGRAAAAVHAVGPPHQHPHPGEPPGHAPDQTQGPGCPDLHPLAGAAGPLPAPDPVLQPLGRHLMEQGRGGPVLLALAGSEHGPGNWRREEWRPGEDQPAEASTCLPRCPEPPPGKGPASRCLAHLSALLPFPTVSSPQDLCLQSSGFPGPPGSSGHHPPHPPSPLCVSLIMNHEQVVMQETLSPAHPPTEKASAGKEQKAAERAGKCGFGQRGRRGLYVYQQRPNCY